MANTTSATAPGKKAQIGILLLAITLVLLLLFGTQRQLVAQGFLSATAGNVAETDFIDIAGQHSPTIEVVTQLQYTQRVLFKAEVLDGRENVITQLSQDLDSRRSGNTRRLDIENWPNPERIKVKLTVSEQSITAQPPAGISASDIPVVFEVNVYRQWFNGRFLWPGLLACCVLLFVVNLARQKAVSWR